MSVASKTVVQGIYDDEEILKKGAQALRAAGIRVKDVFSPFPIHGIDPIIGVPRTRLAICAFIYGITGTFLATLMMWYMMISDWPSDIGGKPNWQYIYNIPAFIPITFESTVLCAAHGMAITYLLRCWLYPGAKAKNPDPRTTDDKFMIYLELEGEQSAKAQQILKETGATEVTTH